MLTTTSSSIASHVPLEDLSEIHPQLRCPRSYLPRVHPKLSVRLPRARPYRWSGNLPRRSPPVIPRALCFGVLRQVRSRGSSDPQHRGSHMCWPGWLRPYIVAGLFGELGRFVYCSEALGVRVSSDVPLYRPLTRPTLGGHGTKCCDRCGTLVLSSR